MKSLLEYIKLKDKCCIFYVGASYEYLVQLVGVLPYIRKSFPDIRIDVFGKDCYCEYIPGILPLSLWEKTKNDYGLCKELTYDLISHPVLKLLEESDIPYGPMETHPIVAGTNLCIIHPEAALPARPLNSLQIAQAKELAIARGYRPEITDNIQDAGWIIGAENGPLFLGASFGIKTSLIPTGLGTKLYKVMFPEGEVLNF